MNPIKIICIVMGFIFFGLAAVGAFFPVLPTTPFLLLAAFFFARGSDRFNTWFKNTKLYQDYAESYLKHQTMTLKTKIFLCALAISMMTVSIILVDVIWVRLFMVTMIIFMLWFFKFRIRTVSPEEDAAIKAADKAEREARAQAQVTLCETMHEVKEMHEELFEEVSAKAVAKEVAPED